MTAGGGHDGQGDAADRTPRPPRLRVRRIAALLALALLAALAGAWVARDRLATRLLVPRLLAALGEAGWQAALADASVEVSPDLRGLRLRGKGFELAARAPGSSLRALQAGELQASAGTADLLAGRWSGLELEARGVRLELDAAAGGEAGGDVDLPALRLLDAALRLHAGPRAPLDLRLDELELRPGGDGALAGRWRGRAFGGRVHLDGTLLRDGDGARLRGALELDGLDAGAAAAWLRPDAGALPAVLASAQGELDLSLGRGAAGLLADSDASLRLDLQAPDARLVAEARLRDGALELGPATLTAAGGRLEVARARLVPAEDPWRSEISLAGRIDLDDLAPLGALAAPLLAPWLERLPGGAPYEPLDFAGTLAGELSVAGPLLRPHVHVDLAGEDVRVAGLQCGDLALRARDEAGVLRVESLALATDGGRLQAHGALDLGALVLDGAHVEAELLAGADAARDVPGLLAAWLLPGVQGRLQAELDLSGPLRAPQVELRAAAERLVVGGTPLSALSLDARLADDAALVRAASLSAASGSLRASGRVEGLAWPPRAVQVEALALEGAGRSLQLQRPFTLRLGAGQVECGRVELAGGGASLVLELASSAQDGGVRHVVDLLLADAGTGPLLDLLPADLGAAGLDGSLHAELLAGAEGAREVVLRGQLGVRGARLAGVTAGGGRLDLAFDLVGPADAPLGTLQVAAGDVTLELPERIAALLEALAGGREIEVVQEGPAGPPRDIGPCRLWLALRAAPGELAIEAAELEAAEELQLQATGRVGAGLDLAAALRGAPLLPPDAPLEGRLRLRALELERFADVLGRVRRLRGELAAEGRLAGTLAAPRLEGELLLHDGELRLASGVPAVTALRARLALRGAEARVTELTGELGSAPFTVTGGAAFGDGGVALDLRLQGADLLLWRGHGASVRADVDLTLTGPAEAPRIAGRLTLTDAQLRRNLSVASLAGAPEGARGPLRLFAFADPPLRDAPLDVTVDARAPLRIENNVVRGGLLPELHLGGTGGRPQVTGSVHVADLRLALPATVLRVTRGRLDFREDDPYAPSVDVQAEARLRGYDVRVRASGPHDQPAFELTSVPPLPGEDVLLLVLTGQPPRAAGADGGAGAARTVALYFGQDLLSRWVGEAGGGDDLVDRLEVDWEQDATDRDAESIRLSWRLAGRPGEDRRLVFLHAERDVWDDVNLGVRWLFILQ